MSRKWFSIIALIAAPTFLCNLSSCGFNQHLVSIDIPESGGTFGGVGPGIYFDFTAIGTYVHPPATKDITDLVTWKSDNPQVVQVSAAGVVSPNVACGLANISASLYDSPNDVVRNAVRGTVEGTGPGCTLPGEQPILTVSFSGNGSGTVTGNGISCTSPSSCSDQFSAGTTVTLTAAPTGGSSFSSWTNCNSTSGSNNSVCTVLLENNSTVTAAFNP